MLSPLATWSSDIILQFDGTMIILIDNIAMYIVSLIFKELLGPYHLCQDTSDTYKIGLGLTLSV